MFPWLREAFGLSYAEHLANGCYYAFALLTFIAGGLAVGAVRGFRPPRSR